MNSADQAAPKISELQQQLSILQKEREISLQDRCVIALTTAYEMETHCTELLSHLRNEMGITFLSSDFAVLSFAGTQPDPAKWVFTPIWTSLVSPIYEKLRSAILSVLNLRHVGLTCDAGGRIYCVLNFAAHTSDFYQEIRSLCDQINRLTQAHYGISFQISVSALGSGIWSLPELRSQLDVLDDYRSALGGHAPALLFYDQIVTPNQEYPFFLRTAHDRFTKYMESGQFDLAKSFFRESIAADFIQAPPPVKLIQLRMSALIDYLLQALYHTCEILELPALPKSIGLPDALLTCGSIDELVLRMDSLFDALSANWTISGSASVHLAQEARAYIQARYTDPELNVNQIAAQLHVTATHLTRSFQTCYHCGVYEYLQQVRLDDAKRQLGSGLSLRQIAARTGFGSSLNMNRAFKRYEGKTPTEYASQAHT